jgi:hypothetical protein
MMVVKLNMILITSPELADFRRRLKNLESKVSWLISILAPCSRRTGWADAILVAVPIMVSQCCGSVCSVPTCSGVRARVEPAADLVRRNGTAEKANAFAC